MTFDPPKKTGCKNFGTKNPFYFTECFLKYIQVSPPNLSAAVDNQALRDVSDWGVGVRLPSLSFLDNICFSLG